MIYLRASIAPCYNDFMGDAFLKAVKWSILVVLGIGGFYFFTQSSKYEDIRYMMPGVLCFGAVYTMFKVWSGLNMQALLYSCGIIIALAFLAQDKYIPYWLYNFGQIYWDYGYFESWAALIGTVGLFSMTIVFYYYNDE